MALQCWNVIICKFSQGFKFIHYSFFALCMLTIIGYKDNEGSAARNKFSTVDAH